MKIIYSPFLFLNELRLRLGPVNNRRARGTGPFLPEVARILEIFGTLYFIDFLSHLLIFKAYRIFSIGARVSNRSECIIYR